MNGNCLLSRRPNKKFGSYLIVFFLASLFLSSHSTILHHSCYHPNSDPCSYSKYRMIFRNLIVSPPSYNLLPSGEDPNSFKIWTIVSYGGPYLLSQHLGGKRIESLRPVWDTQWEFVSRTKNFHLYHLYSLPSSCHNPVCTTKT